MSGGTLISYSIALTTEILGLSHKEREEIANIIRYNIYYLPSEKKARKALNTADYMKVAKLASILRVADVLDVSHKQKIEDLKVTIKDNTLNMATDTLEDITLETGLLGDKTELFMKVYGIKPVVRQKRGL
jgi:exopolyphosphatase/guanosine-5'-triphosphate,3'-diphosphate pyrophosphatase